MSLSILTSDGQQTTLDAAALTELRASVRGRVLDSASPGYDEARAIWNAMIDRRPALIVQCTSAADVAGTVTFARRHNLAIAVRGGGHNIAGLALCDNGLVIDLSPMQAVHVNAAARTARVEAGATLGVVDAATQAHGLATPLGINSTTGVAGLTLGGGFGWLSRRFGLSIDNLLGVDIVTAAGDFVRANAAEHPDLFWAIRGGGGNFGIVTAFDFQLHDVGPQVLSGLIIHPLDDALSVMRFYREFMKTAPEELVCWFVMRQAPPLPFLPPEWHGREILALAVCYSGAIADGERIAAPLRGFGRPLADVIAPHPYTAWQQILDPLLASGARNYWKSHDFADVSDGLIEVFVDYARRLPDPQTEIACAQLGGAVSRVAPDATAYAHRDATYVLNVHGRWSDPAKDEACIGWARGLFRAAAPFATGGAYVNFLTQEEGDRVRAAYGVNYDRLVAIKTKYDPTNVLRANQNIRPAPAAAASAAGA